METNLLADELANSIMNIIDAETHPLKRKPHKNGIACSEVRKKLDDYEGWNRIFGSNPVAKEVRTPKFKSQVIKSKKIYDRKKPHED